MTARIEQWAIGVRAPKKIQCLNLKATEAASEETETVDMIDVELDVATLEVLVFAMVIVSEMALATGIVVLITVIIMVIVEDLVIERDMAIGTGSPVGAVVIAIETLVVLEVGLVLEDTGKVLTSRGKAAFEGTTDPRQNQNSDRSWL